MAIQMRTNTKATITAITPAMTRAGDMELPALETKNYKTRY